MKHRDGKRKATVPPVESESVLRPIEPSPEPSQAASEAETEVRKTEDPLPIPKLLTREDVMEILGCGETTLGKLRREGKLISGKIVSMVRYKPEDVQAYIDSCWPYGRS